MLGVGQASSVGCEPIQKGLVGMRIGMIVHAYYLKDARVRRYAELLAAEGHRVDVLCLGEAGCHRRALLRVGEFPA